MTNKCLKSIIVIFLALITVALIQAQSGAVIISEFMAINNKNLMDEDNQYNDWIEIYNASDITVNLDGWFLTDKSDNLPKWKFPAVMLEAGKYLVIFASEKNRKVPGATLHTNFKLSGTGEFLAIVQPDTVISHAYQPAFPSQRQDVSYGLFRGQEVYFDNPTPGAENQAGSLPFAPAFSIGRGYYSQPFDVTLSAPASAGNIYFTLNGARPTKTNATIYTNPVRITTTTPLSAVVIDDAGNSSEVITHTYLFLSDVLKQPKAPAGYPTDWRQEGASAAIPADYEMDQRVVTHADYKNDWEVVMNSLPTVSFVTDISNLFSNKNNAVTGGIYIFTGKPSSVGVGWVRPASAEYFDPKTGKQFQINCGLELHGGNSRNPGNSPKHGFKLRFQSVYGPSKLNFNLFDESTATNVFNSLVFRAGYNYTWVKNAVAQQTPAQYIQDSWSKNTQQAMGQLSAHEKFVHLYINGLYWGLYNISEHLTNDYMESYLPGSEDDFDIIKEKQDVTAGNIEAWNALKAQITGVETNAGFQKIQGKNPDGTFNPAFSNLLEVDNYIDYMLINYYIANQDWDANNWTVARNRVRNDFGFRFFCWDTETSMIGLNDNRIITGTAGNPAAFMQYLKKNTDFKVRIADRIKKHLLDAGGALTPTEVAKRYNALADEIDMAIIGESARWSDWYPPYNPYTKFGHWIPRKNDLLNNYFPQRTNILMNQLRAAGLYPTINAPQFSHPEGVYKEKFNLSMISPTGTIYYTTDGTDPRLEIASTVSNNALTYNSAIEIGASARIKARVKSSTEWSAISEAVYTVDPYSSLSAPDAGKLMVRNFPNPFTSSTRIRMELPFVDDLRIAIYDLQGRLVEELYSGTAISGTFEIDWQADNATSGVYICRINYGEETTHLKILKR